MRSAYYSRPSSRLDPSGGLNIEILPIKIKSAYIPRKIVLASLHLRYNSFDVLKRELRRYHCVHNFSDVPTFNLFNQDEPKYAESNFTKLPSTTEPSTP